MNEFQNSGQGALERRIKAVELVRNLKFPRIHHVFTESSHTLDDLIAAQQQREAFLTEFNGSRGVVTEKIDGSNIGISFTSDGQLQLRHRGGVCNEQDIKYKAAFEWAKGNSQLLKDCYLLMRYCLLNG